MTALLPTVVGPSRFILLLRNSRVVCRRNDRGGLWLLTEGWGVRRCIQVQLLILGGSLPPVLVFCFRWAAGGWRCNGARVCCSGGGVAGLFFWLVFYLFVFELVHFVLLFHLSLSLEFGIRLLVGRVFGQVKVSALMVRELRGALLNCVRSLVDRSLLIRGRELFL